MNTARRAGACSLSGHLKTRAALQDYTKRDRCGSWRCAADTRTPSSNLASTSCCRRISSLSTAPAARCACCRWGASTAVLKLPASPTSFSAPLARRDARAGKNGSLLQAKARGADIRIVYSPMDALTLAEDNPARKVVFLAWGLKHHARHRHHAAAGESARRREFFLFCQHITLIPTLRSMLEEPGNGIDAFLAPGHVSMVIGTDAYGFIAEQYNRPLVVAGFEPLDLLQGVTCWLSENSGPEYRGKPVPPRGTGCGK